MFFGDATATLVLLTLWGRSAGMRALMGAQALNAEWRFYAQTYENRNAVEAVHHAAL